MVRNRIKTDSQMLCANMDRLEKLKPLVIGKSKTHDHSRTSRYLPSLTLATTKCGWCCRSSLCGLNNWTYNMLQKTDVCSSSLTTAQRTLKSQAYKHSNCTSSLQTLPHTGLQPMDQGVIMSFKSHNRRRLVKCHLESYEAGETPASHCEECS